MRTKRHIPPLLMGLLLLSEVLPAQEYLDLWHNGKTNDFYLIQQKANEYFVNRDKGRGSGYKQFKRWEEFMAPRVYPSGKLINPAKLALDEELRYQGGTHKNQRKMGHTGNWQPLGIKNYISTATGLAAGGMGRVNCIVPHPTDPQTLFIGTPVGGIWKTTDGGNNWIPLSDGLPVIGVSGIAVNPEYSDSIYILTGDGDGRDTYSTGVLLSTNGGDTWQSTGLQWNQADKVYGFKLLMHPSNRKTLFAVTNRGIYRTINGGITWRNTIDGSFSDLAFNPSNPSIMYATGFDLPFCRSTNGGVNWAQFQHPFSGRAAIGVTAANSNYVYIVVGTSTDFLGLLLSTDGGLTFNLQSDSPPILSGEIAPPFYRWTQALYDLTIAVSPTNAQEVHVGGINCWKSTNAGVTWNYTSYQNQQQAPAGKYTHADIHSLVFNGNTLYCGSDGGVYKSTDHAASWTDLSYGLEITQFYSIGAPPDNLNVLYGGTQDNGLNKWSSSNAAIMEHNLPGDVFQCLIDYTDNQKVYAVPYAAPPDFNPLYVTSNAGASWQKYSRPAGAIGIQHRVPLVMNPTDHTIVYAGYNPVYEITDLGSSAIFFPLSPNLDSDIRSLGVSAANSSYLYVTTGTSVKLSTNINSWFSPSWNDITGTLPLNAAYIYGIAVSPVDANTAWVCFSGYVDGIKVYQTSDAGATWTNISGTLPNVPVNCIVYDNNFHDGVYIGTDIGVFYRDNTMTDWIPFRNGMPNVTVVDLKITNTMIRAATYGRGIWESDLYQVCDDAYTLSGDVTGYQFFESSDIITSNANIKGGIGTKVQYKAANSIELNTGFRVAPHSVFKASIADCSNSTSNRALGSNRRYRGIYEGVMPGALGIASIADNTTITLSADRLKVYPNPFSQQSTVEFFIAKQTAVTISLWNQAGKKIKNLFESVSQAPGNYQVRLDADRLGSGTYMVRLQTQDYQETKKIVITK